MKKIMIGALVAATLVGATVLTSKTFSTLHASDVVANELSSGSIDIEVNENGFKDKETWNGEETDKKVQITNRGKNPSLIRVAIIPRWVDENGEPWAGDASFAKINFANLADENNPENYNEGKWLKDSEGKYYYYTAYVESDKDTNPIIESVSLDIPENLKSSYEGKKLIVDVKSEAVLAEKDPYDSEKAIYDSEKAIYEKTWSNVQDKNVKAMLDGLIN